MITDSKQPFIGIYPYKEYSPKRRALLNLLIENGGI